MKFRGGYSVSLEGRPDSNVTVLPEPDTLYLPLTSERFNFSAVLVAEGQKVDTGQVLATDPENFGIPLLSPRAGTVTLDADQSHITIKDVSKEDAHPDLSENEIPHIIKELGENGTKRYKLVNLGAWQYFYDAYTGNLPDPMGTPQAIIASLVSFEPFLARGDVQLKKRLIHFTRGLEYLQTLIEYQPIFLVVPDIQSELAAKVKEHIRGYAWAKLVEVPLEYTRDDFNILARHLDLKRADGPVWSVRTEGVLAVDRALTINKAVTVRLLSVGGPGVTKPEHIKVMCGYPLKKITDEYARQGDMRLVNGGFFRGTKLIEGDIGVSTECTGITILPEHKEREFLGWLRPGFDRSSYSKSFLSAFRGKFAEKFTTTIRGEVRACVSCGFCEEVCPAGIMPHIIHKYIYSDLIEEADAARVDLCVKCGLCSFVCPSKIELRKEFIEMQKVIEQEKQEALEQKRKQQEKQKEQQPSSEETLY